jgi:rubrerythrin
MLQKVVLFIQKREKINSGFKPVKGDFMNIIECTIKMRKEAQANYANLSMATADKELKRLFAMLAAAEDEHIDNLQAINEEFKASVAIENRFSDNVCVYNPQVSTRNLGKALRHDPDAYIHVLKEEEEAIEFFDRLAAETERGSMKKVCLAAAAKEREHLQIIENIYSFVEEPRTYLEWGEFSNLKSL